MKSIYLFALAGFAAANVIERRATACTPDNCLRALTGTGSNSGTTRPVVAKADCSSYFSTVVTSTVTPATITVFPTVSITVSSTVTGTDTIQVTITNTETDPTTTTTTITDTTAFTPLVKRDTATNIPSYASACSGAVRYSSACSCLGVTATTSTLMITLATPSATVTVTATNIITETATSLTTVLNTATTTTLTTEIDTATAVATVICSAGAQIVSNPSFEQHNSFTPVGWTQQSSQFALANFGFCAEDGTQCEYFVGNGGPISGSVSQVLTNACPGATYTFSAYVGYYYSGVSSPFDTYITVTLGGVTIIPRQLTCSDPSSCTAESSPGSSIFYRKIQATAKVTAFDPLLVVLLDSPANSQEIYDTALDNVQLVQV